MDKKKKLVIVGEGEFGEIAYEYFMYDSEYEVKAFAVEKKYHTKDSLFHLPIINFEDMERIYPPEEYGVFVAITYTKLNRVRSRLYRQCKEKGYTCASYISSRAFVWNNVKIGENTFVFENNTIQYLAEIGNNVILWSGNHIGHRTQIKDDCWLSSQAVVSGFCMIETGCFIGVNVTIGDNVSLARDTVMGAGAVIVKSITEAGKIYVGNPARLLNETSYEKFKVEEEEK